MGSSKFQELCKAYSKAQTDFGTYQDQCHQFSISLVKELKAFLQIPESQFSLYKINEEQEFEIVPPSLINAINLLEDSYWQFGIGLTVCSAPETLPQELILISVTFKKNMDETFTLKYGIESTEFTISQKDPDSYLTFFKFMHEQIMSAYNDQLQEFIGQDTKRTLGYKNNNKAKPDQSQLYK